MTSESDMAGDNLDRMNANLARIEELSQRLVAALARREHGRPSLQAPDNEIFLKAATAYMTEMVQNPSKMLEHQVSYWGNALKHYVEVQEALAAGKFEAPEDDTPKDKR